MVLTNIYIMFELKYMYMYPSSSGTVYCTFCTPKLLFMFDLFQTYFLIVIKIQAL